MSNDTSGDKTNRNQQTLDSTRANEKADSGSPRETNLQGDIGLADMASQLKSLEQKLAKQPDVDQAHVNRVREAIHRGEYQINPERVADKMLGIEEDS